MRRFVALIGWVICVPVLAAPVALDGVRLSKDSERTRVVLDLSGSVRHRLFQLSVPTRVVVDLEGTSLADGAPESWSGLGAVDRVRTGARSDGVLRVVLDVAAPVQTSSFLLQPAGSTGHRLVIDLRRSSDSVAVVKTVTKLADGQRDVVIAIDAGHGGKDAGARGRRVLEKNITLEIARRLKRQIDAEPGMRAVLTRDRDEFVDLRQRINLARIHEADLFVSIHADAFRNTRARGSSVYVLSQRGASSEAARWLAERENAALLGGVSLDDKGEELASVLLDLSQNATMSASLDAADAVLAEIGSVNRLHSRKVNQAGFLVLKSPDIPSVLIETAFISNPSEASKLTNPNHQEKLAGAILSGVRSYFREYAPPGTMLAALNRARARNELVEHVITSGETLSEIAERYDVSLRSLRSANRLASDRIRIGQVLRIPLTTGT